LRLLPRGCKRLIWEWLLAKRAPYLVLSLIEAAVMSFLLPDGADRCEAAFTRRFDRLIRQIQRLGRNTSTTMEMLAVFVRFLLTIRRRCPAGARRYHPFCRRLYATALRNCFSG
jgi:hypothetical protein